MKYASPAAFRVALETRLLTESRVKGMDLGRLRRRTVFERILTRLESRDPGRWVLKGGMALEVRWQDRARATRDLDLAIAHVVGSDELRVELTDALMGDPDGDWFEFLVAAARALPSDEAGLPGWRFTVDARLAGKTYASVTIDVVVRPTELDSTERLKLAGVLAFAGIEPRDVEVVDLRQHFAEKLHAFTRNYGDRPNTRVKDLPDLILLIEAGLEPTASLRATVDRVFTTRGKHHLPHDIADPPLGWQTRYAELATDLDIAAATLPDAMTRLRLFWADTLHATD